jgi:endonuclease YncB( thermonuclease family)
MQNSSLNILIAGIILALLLIVFQDQKTQQSLVYYLGLEQTAQSAIKTSKSSDINSIETGLVNRVIDGDTIVLDDGRTIRYLNVDTPETKKPNTIVQCFGPEASAYNSALVQGKKISLRRDKENEDRYGRDLRYVFLEGRDASKIENSINAIMVRQGYGKALIIKPNNTYEDEFRKMEAEAKNQKVGIWGRCSNPFVD